MQGRIKGVAMKKLFTIILLTAFVGNAHFAISAQAIARNGKCTACGKLVMKGASHICTSKGGTKSGFQKGKQSNVSPQVSKARERVAQERAAYHVVKGLFGVHLGEVVGDAFTPVYGHLGEYTFTPKKDHEPFVKFYVKATPVTKKIYEIRGVPNGQMKPVQSQKIWFALCKEYKLDQAEYPTQQVYLPADKTDMGKGLSVSRKEIRLYDQAISREAQQEIRQNGDKILLEEWNEMVSSRSETESK